MVANLVLGIAILLILAIAVPWAQDTLDQMLDDFFDDWG
jgi:hypothetical protein